MPNIGPLACIQKKAKGSGALGEAAMMTLKKDVAEFKANNPTAGEAQQAEHALMVAQNRIKFKKIQTALQIDAMNRLTDRSKMADERGLGAAMMSMLVRDYQGKMEGANVEAVWQETMRIAQGKFSKGFERFRSTKLGWAQDETGLNNFMSELFGQDSGDASAKALADAWKNDVDPFLYRSYRAAGGNLTPRKDWNVPQHHDPSLVARVSKDEWKSKITPLLNRSEMIDRETGAPLSDARLEEIIDEAYESISLNGLNREGSAGGGSKLANRHTAERVFVFKDSESFQAYDKEFGSGGDIFGLITGHIDRMSREVAVMKVLGPNPDALMQEMVRLTNLSKAEKVRGKDGKAAHFFGSVTDTSPGKAIENTYHQITGRNERAGSDFGAGFFAGTRNLLTSAQLGGAYLASLTDWNYQRLAASFNGLSASGAWGKSLGQFVNGSFSSEGTEFAVRLGLGAEAWANTAFGAQRIVGDVVGPAWTRKVADTVMRASLLSPWTQAARHGFGLEVLGTIGDYAKRKVPFSEIDQSFREGLERRGIDEKDWDAITSSTMEDRNGIAYASILNVADTDSGAASKLSQFITEETEFATPQGSARARAILTQGTQPGTIAGEVMRSTAMYKMFPLMIMQTHLARALYGAGESHRSQMGYTVDLFISSAIFGAAVIQAKQIAAGKDPIPTTGEDAAKFWTAAMLQGGALGVAGDFLFSDESRFGKTFTQTLAGPVFNAMDDVKNLTLNNANEMMRGEDTKAGREAARFFGKYMPGGNLWYSRIAFERMVVDRLQTMLDPRASASFNQRKAKQTQDYGTGWWWGPGSEEPDRAPNITE